jgi:catalase
LDPYTPSHKAQRSLIFSGQPLGSASTAQKFTDGTPIKGLMLLQDTALIETLAHFSRERIPERTVHARAAGAWGEFEVTHDISHLTDAKFLNGIGTKSKTLQRISTVGGGRGSADTARDVRGWALKIFTEDGNQDFVFNDIVSGRIILLPIAHGEANILGSLSSSSATPSSSRR